MRRRLLLPIALLSVLILPADVFAQKADAPKKLAESPEDVFLKSREALKLRDFQDFAESMVPDDLIRFQTHLLSFVEVTKKRGEERDALRLFAGVNHVDDLKSLAPKAFLVAFFNGLMGASPAVQESLGKGKITIVGRVDEGRDTTFLIYRVIPHNQAGVPDVVRATALHRDEKRWKILLDGEMERTFLVLKSQLEGRKQAPPGSESLRVETVGRINDKDGTAYIPYRVILPAGDSHVTRFGVYPVKKTERVYKLLKDGKTPEIKATIRDMLRSNFAAKQAAERKNLKP
jgi:hypothetical protein